MPFTDTELDGLAHVALIAGAGTIAQASVFPEYGLGAGFLIGAFVCLPALVSECRKWHTACMYKKTCWAKTCWAFTGMAMFTLLASAISNTCFTAVQIVLGL